jgi:hypothetical protein
MLKSPNHFDPPRLPKAFSGMPCLGKMRKAGPFRKFCGKSVRSPVPSNRDTGASPVTCPPVPTARRPVGPLQGPGRLTSGRPLVAAGSHLAAGADPPGLQCDIRSGSQPSDCLSRHALLPSRPHVDEGNGRAILWPPERVPPGNPNQMTVLHVLSGNPTELGVADLEGFGPRDAKTFSAATSGEDGVLRECMASRKGGTVAFCVRVRWGQTLATFPDFALNSGE